MLESQAWTNGRIFTGRRYVEAILVENGRVVTAGSVEEVRRARPTGAERRDLRGRLVLPGFIDAHLHLIDTALQRAGVDLRGVRSLEEIENRTEEWMRSHPRGSVLGRGWDQDKLKEQRYPTRDDLDRIAPDRPIILFRVCHHVAAVNSLVLEQLELNEASPVPAGGRLGRDRQGRLNGLLFDNALRDLSSFVQATFFEHPELVETTLAEAVSRGLTTLAVVSASPEEIRWAAERFRTRQPPTRLRYYLDAERMRELPDLARLPYSDAVRLVGIKAVFDGSFGARTAWLRESYTDRPDETGFPLWSEEALSTCLEEAERRGLGVAVHAIGDRALVAVLRILTNHPKVRPPRIEHASLTPPELFPLLDSVRPDLVVQPGFVISDSWIVDRLGPERARWTYAFRTLVSRGYRLAGSSDAPVEPLDPWWGIQAAVHRASHRQPFEGPESTEGLDPEVAVTLYTRNGGEVLGAPGLGTLEPGAPADLILLRVSHLTEAIPLGGLAILETWRAGQSVFVQPESTA